MIYRVGQPCHFSDESGTRDIYLRVIEVRPIGGLVILKSDDGYYEFGLRPNSKGLIQITEEQYRDRSVK